MGSPRRARTRRGWRAPSLVHVRCGIIMFRGTFQVRPRTTADRGRRGGGCADVPVRSVPSPSPRLLRTSRGPGAVGLSVHLLQHRVRAARPADGARCATGLLMSGRAPRRTARATQVAAAAAMEHERTRRRSVGPPRDGSGHLVFGVRDRQPQHCQGQHYLPGRPEQGPRDQASYAPPRVGVGVEAASLMRGVLSSAPPPKCVLACLNLLALLALLVKNMGHYFAFEVEVVDDKGEHRRFRASNFQVCGPGWMRVRAVRRRPLASARTHPPENVPLPLPLGGPVGDPARRPSRGSKTTSARCLSSWSLGGTRSS